MHKTLPGIDIFLQQEHYKNKRIGFVTNDAAITAAGQPSRVALLKNGFNIVKLFSPEHGISRAGDDGAAQYDHTDHLTGIPVISLYGEKMTPAEKDLAAVDLLLFDIPDVGCRFYTYLWTLSYIMEAAAAFNKPLIIADRPNPTGALLHHAEGPWLDESSCSSFIGRWNIPVRHCCTLAELALYFNTVKNIKAAVTVMKNTGYRRSNNAIADFSFTPTSPAIQNIATALLYPGTGLLEAIYVNEGRGTNAPFVCFGAPWINEQELLQHWQRQNIAGIVAAAVSYTPQNSIYAGETCRGLHFAITDGDALKPVAAGIRIIELLLQLYPSFVQERLYKTAANPAGTNHLDKLLGVHNAFTLLQQGGTVQTAIQEAWAQKIKPFLLY